MDLNRIGLMKLVVGKTLREQLEGKKLAGADIVEFIRSFDRMNAGFVPPAHWEGPDLGSGIVDAFCLTAQGPSTLFHRQDILGFAWFPKGLSPHTTPHVIERRGIAVPEGDILDCMVVDPKMKVDPGSSPAPKCWAADDRILIELE